MEHSPGFLAVVNEARGRVKEVSVYEARTLLQKHPGLVLMDVREDHEWSKGHAIEAVHLGRGILERDLEKMYPDPKTEIIMYCGGGYRSILAADAAQKMGYHHVYSLKGGYKELVSTGWPIAQ